MDSISLSSSFVIPSNPATIPEQLKHLPQWVCWRYEERSGKQTKAPIDAKSNGRLRYAKTNDSATWAEFDAALAACELHPELAGVGFCFSPSDGLTGIDLDHVLDLDTKALTPEAAEIVARFAGTYIEVSPSGTGLRLFCKGKPARSGKNVGKGKWLEVYAYPSNRYLTVTGQHWLGSTASVTEQQAALDWLHERFMASTESPPVDSKSAPASTLNLGDSALLTKATQAKNGVAFDALWRGDLSAHGNDASAADLALCNLLAFWTDGDATRIDRLFRQSGLMRDKWDVVHSSNSDLSYGAMTITKAIAGLREGYSGHGPLAHCQTNNEATAGKAESLPKQAEHSPFPLETERPCYQVLDDWAEWQGEKKRPGVYWCTVFTDKSQDTTLIELWFCSPLYIEAITFDGQANNFGRLLRFKNSLGRWREWAMPMELLRGSGEELRGELLAMGVEIDPHHGRQQLSTYLQFAHPQRRMRCALQVGWAGQSFVLPDAVIGPDAAGVIFQSGERGYEEHTKAGTLHGWQEHIGAKAIGNPLLLLALSAGFAGPMLARCNAEGGGIHFVGDSSTGKTTAIEAACSIWGGPNYRRSWRATANGMEGAAVLFNDCLLALDELSECDPKEVGAIVYSLGNGRGKQRASKSGAARSVVRWRCFVLSSGERTISTTMAEGGHRSKAGQSMRLLDIPVARAFGAWDQLHGAPSAAAFSDGIKRMAAAHHGLIGRAFLEKLTHDSRDFCTTLEAIKELPLFAVEGGEGQDKRAAGRFALIGLAGELATEYGFTGWPEGAAIRATAECFTLWRSMRGKGNDEQRQIAERLSGFLERHGDGRFSDVNAHRDEPIRDRAGWWRGSSDGREYLLTAEAMREALKGFDFARALDALESMGALPKPGADGKRARFHRIGGRGVKLYPINPDKLTGGEHGA